MYLTWDRFCTANWKCRGTTDPALAPPDQLRIKGVDIVPLKQRNAHRYTPAGPVSSIAGREVDRGTSGPNSVDFSASEEPASEVLHDIEQTAINAHDYTIHPPSVHTAGCRLLCEEQKRASQRKRSRWTPKRSVSSP